MRLSEPDSSKHRRSTTRGRHRLGGTSPTPISELVPRSGLPSLTAHAQAVTVSKTPRRVASVATLGGLVFSTFGAAASQTVPAEIPETNSLDSVGVTAQVPAAVAPVVQVPSTVEIQFEGIEQDAVAVVEVTPAPEPEPEPPPAPVFAAASNFGASVASIAARYQGVPYLWGGNTPAGFDCSGFTVHVFRQVGVNLPRTSSAQRGAGTVVSPGDARPGDLVWWSGHVAIYLGGGMIIDSPSPGGVVSIRPMFRPNPTFIRLG